MYQGELPAPRDDREGLEAALGNCIHFVTQDGLRCSFPKTTLAVDVDALWRYFNEADALGEQVDRESLSDHEKTLVSVADHFFDGDFFAAYEAFKAGDPRCFQPPPDKWETAAKLWKGDLNVCREQVRAAATLAASKIPALPTGEVWRAEDAFENHNCTGHTDFLRQDFRVLGDLKTTAKPPKGGWVKPDHLMQVTSYHNLNDRRTERAWVCYVDSQKARWVNLVWIDFTTDAMKFYADQVDEFCSFLMSDQLFDVAHPNLGDHCVHSWCKHKPDCYSRIMPPPGSLYNKALARMPTGPIRLKAL